MRFGYSNKYVRTLVELPFFVALAVGWYVSGFVGLIGGGIVGFLVIFGTETYWPRWATDLEWDDLKMALKNLNVFGSDYAVGLVVIVGQRRVEVFKDKFLSMQQPLGVAYRLQEWATLIDHAELRRLIAKSGGGKVYRKGLFGKRLCIVPQESAVEVCLAILRYFVERSPGGLASVRVRERFVNRSVWVSADDQQKAPVPLVQCNFLGKRNGMTIFTMPSGEKKVITPDGIVDYVEELK